MTLSRPGLKELSGRVATDMLERMGEDWPSRSVKLKQTCQERCVGGRLQGANATTVRILKLFREDYKRLEAKTRFGHTLYQRLLISHSIWTFQRKWYICYYSNPTMNYFTTFGTEGTPVKP